jgi:hypothetical protein
MQLLIDTHMLPYCLTKQIKKGFVKASMFKNSRNEATYSYCWICALCGFVGIKVQSRGSKRISDDFKYANAFL